MCSSLPQATLYRFARGPSAAMLASMEIQWATESAMDEIIALQVERNGSECDAQIRALIADVGAAGRGRQLGGNSRHRGTFRVGSAGAPHLDGVSPPPGPVRPGPRTCRLVGSDPARAVSSAGPVRPCHLVGLPVAVVLFLVDRVDLRRR